MKVRNIQSKANTICYELLNRMPFISQHEKASVEMLEFLLEENKLRDEFKKSGLTEIDIMFIKEQIYSEGKVSVDTGRIIMQKKKRKESRYLPNC